MTRPNTEVASFRYVFEELPLIVEGDFSAGLVNGSAEISYWREDGYTEVFVGRIWLDGHRKATAEEIASGSGLFITRDVEITQDEHSAIYLAIFGQLDDGSWREHITGLANEKMAEAA